MARQTSLFGKITGKLGAVVFATSGGQTISREYNPHVANPNTDAQINQRARMKLMSQLSACLAPVIAMQKDGLVSVRNLFVKRNFESCYSVKGQAQISYENVQLTQGNAGLPVINYIVSSATVPPILTCYFKEAPNIQIARVVWCLFRKTDEGKLSFIESKIITEREDGINPFYFVSTFDSILIDSETGKLAADYVIYAYGMIDASERASAQYGNLNVNTATDIADLITNRRISYMDYQFTQTRGTSANRGTSQSTDVPVGSARVFVTALGSGTVSGGGTYELGTSVTVVATPGTNATFVGWRVNGQQNYISRQASYTFTLNQQADLVAVFEGGGNDSL
jgi:hypothetical protein